MTVDVGALWDFNDPAGSEARFRQALSAAHGDDALVLRTQLARAIGLRGEPGLARAELEAIRPLVERAGAEALARWHLELGRTWVSAVTAPADRTPDAVAAAATAYGRAFGIARDAGLDGLAIDAVHMQAIVASEPAEQLAWNERGLALSLASSDPAARRWEASLRNNAGMALHELGRHEEALASFRAALALRERMGDAGNTAVARWMVAWELRTLGQTDEALEIQLGLERELDAAGTPDPFVFRELAALYRERGDEQRAARYDARQAATTG
ncbi:MAG TPA: tetratricopeptide repeat protein [Candidatus Limnocylindrales bacterium]|nr:tetratricopeptide repeat protein [Candidatus Limnocylindrales bacterium]